MNILGNHLRQAGLLLETVGSHRDFQEVFGRAAEMMVHALASKGLLMVAGNGGSAAEAQHFSAEIVGRYKTERKGLPAIALTTDTSALTAIGNDYSFENVFARQVEALGRQGDVLFVLSTSGNSPNIVRAVEQAKDMGIRTIGLLGKDGGVLKGKVDIALVVPSDDTARIQEMHLLVIHALSEYVDVWAEGQKNT